ncbi:ComEC/Rec2 family competence protein [Georgenia sp.]
MSVAEGTPAGVHPVAVDARLVPSATVAWVGAFVAVTQQAGMVLVAAFVVAALAAITAAELLRERRHASAVARTRRRHRGVNRSPPAAAGLLALAVLLAVLASTAAQLHARGTGLLAEVAARGGSAVLVADVAAEPRPVPPREWDTTERFRVVLTTTEVAARGSRGAAVGDVVLVGPAAWGDLALGEQVSVRATLTPTRAGDGAVALAFTDRPPEITGAPGGHLAVVNHVRRSLRDLTADFSPQARGLVPGIAVGDDRALSPELAEAMRATSLTHLTAVSGAHIAILLGLVVVATSWLPRRGQVVVGAVALGAFVTLVRPEASVLRSAVMGAVVLAALLLGRPARALPALCLAVAALLVLDPWLARSYGFTLSVLATAGLVLLARPWRRWLSQVLPRWLATAVAIPAAAQAVCGPVIVLLEPVVATYAVPANILAAPAVPPATVLGVAAALLAPVWPAGAHVPAVLAAGSTWWIAQVAERFAALPSARLPWASGLLGAVLLAVATAVLVVVLARTDPRRVRRVAPVALLTVVLVLGAREVVAPRGGWWGGPWPPPGWVAIQCDVGQGSAFVLRDGARTVMVDVGPPAGGADRCLRTAGIDRLDLLVLTHAHADHVGGLAEVLEVADVGTVLLGPGELPASAVRGVEEALARADVELHRPVVGHPWAAGDLGGLTWQVLWPTAEVVPRLAGADGVNDLSLAVRLRTPSVSVLALGDVELAGQAGLLRRLREAGAPGRAERAGVDVVLVAHHGSPVQDPALAVRLDTRLALVSVGADNDYGHPASGTLALYGGTGAVVLRTDRCGAIAVVETPAGLGTVSGCPP